MGYFYRFFISGQAFFAGQILLILGVALSFLDQKKLYIILVRSTIFLGVILVLFSSTPAIAILLRIMGLLLIALFLSLHFGPKSKTLTPFTHSIRAALIFCAVYSMLSEFVYWKKPQFKSPQASQRMFIIGDSISAGIAYKNEVTWPELLRDNKNVEVLNFSVGGSKLEDAVARTEKVYGEGALVILEIGGNDILTETNYDKFEKDLESLLKNLRNNRIAKRTIIMFELPLPPFKAGYGEIQRKLANRYSVVLIPRRYMASLLFSDKYTKDGIHLTNAGHQKMAEIVWDCVNPFFEKKN